MTWIQVYTPVFNLSISALLAVLPFVLLCWQLLIRRKGGHIASLTAWLGAALVAVLAWQMPISMVVSSSLFGAAFGAFPILWMIVCAMWLYNMTVDSGQFSIVRDSISAMTNDRRIQAIFIAFAFGALLESTAGYGAPVAIGAAMLVGLGFPPLQAAVLCLIANTVPVAYAGMGLPAIVAAQVSELDAFRISQFISIQLPLIAVFIPLWLSILVCGFKRSLEIWPVLVVGGLGLSVPTFLFGYFQGPTLPGLMGALGSMLGMGILLYFWKPTHVYRFATDILENEQVQPQHSKGVIFRAWLPWIVLVAMVSLSSVGFVRDALNNLFCPMIEWPGLHKLVIKNIPIVSMPLPFGAIYKFNFLSSPGTSLFVAGLLAPLVMPNYSYKRAFKSLCLTVKQMRLAIFTVLNILALSQLMNYSGMSYTLGLVFTKTGWLYAFFAPVLGWIGVFMTGSDTSSNALFCGIQRTTAQMVGMDPYLATAANTTGGVAAKMISPQSIAVASGAIAMGGQEGSILKQTIFHSLLMLGILCMMTMALALWM